MAKIGVDVGGTFTDLILETKSGSSGGVFVHKVPSTPADQSIGVLDGIMEICKIAGVKPQDVELIVHGTTIATNITLEHSGSEVGMVTTRGFRDILHIARHKRPHNFSMQFDVPWQSRPLVKRRNRIPITERILPPDGRVDTPLDADEVRAACVLFRERGIESVIVCFLVRVPEYRPRAEGEGHCSRRNAGRFRVDLVRSGRRDSRIRTLLDHGNERVCRPQGVALFARPAQQAVTNVA